MKVFILGMPGSCRTTFAKAISKSNDFKYVDAYSWVKKFFRDQNDGEHINQYYDAYHNWLTDNLKLYPNIFYNYIKDICVENTNQVFIIDGIFSPVDFIKSFNYNTDMVIFLNRLNNNSDHRDYENIGVSVMRDFCFWLSSADLLSKEKWIELNFQIPGEDSDFIKQLGKKNSVYIVKNLNNGIKLIEELIFKSLNLNII